MPVYSLYIFDRHCNVVYYQDWSRSPAPTATKAIIPGVASSVTIPQTSSSTATGSAAGKMRHITSNSGTVIAVTDQPGDISVDQRSISTAGGAGGAGGSGGSSGTGLPFDEEAKLVYGVVLSLKNMVKKLTGNPASQFHNYSTPSYTLHSFETPTLIRFILLTSPLQSSDASSLVRTTLKNIWSPEGAYGKWVALNPLKGDTNVGWDSEQFRAQIDQQIRALPFFSST